MLNAKGRMCINDILVNITLISLDLFRLSVVLFSTEIVEKMSDRARYIANMGRECYNKQITLMSNVNLIRKSDVATENVTGVCEPTSRSVDYNTDNCVPQTCEGANPSNEVVSTVVDLISSTSEAVEHDNLASSLDIINMDVIFEENINNAEITSVSLLQTENPVLTHDSFQLNDTIEEVLDHEEYQKISVNDEVGDEIEKQTNDDYIRDNEEENSPTDEASDAEKLRNEFGMKRKRKVNQREICKAKRNRGEFYIGHKNKEKQEKKVKENPCIEGCANSCKDISENQRKILFENYWALSHQRKKDFIVNHIDIHEVKRRRVKTESRKSLTRDYFLPKGDEKVKVCRRFFMKTLDVSDKLLRYTEDNRSDIKTSKIDERGKHDPKNKTPAEYTDYVISFIDKLPAVPSHYCRKDSTRKYLPTEFKNISNLYRIYEKYLDQENINKKPNKVSLQVFKKIFKNDFNIGFHIPKKDKCLRCEKYKNSQNDLISEEQQSEYGQHIKEKELTNKAFSEDQKRGQEDGSVLCTSFDLQKVLGTPNGDNFLLGFSSKYAVYNLTFYESITRNVICYLWGESDGKRGANEICTILHKYLTHIDGVGSIKELLLYCDSCAGQNKNHQVLCLIQWFLKSSSNLKRISINFLLPGHSYMPVDSVHGTIEQTHKHKVIYAPSEWPTIIRNARHNPKPYDIVSLTYKDFLDYKSFAEKNFPKIYKTEAGTSVKIRQMRRIIFSKDDPKTFVCKTSFSNSSPEFKICFPMKVKRTSATNTSKPLGIYKTKLPIASKKYMGLRSLCNNLVIPKNYHHEFLCIPYKADIQDVLPETDEEDESNNCDQ